MRKLWKEIKYWLQLLLLPVYALSCLMPRNKKIWAFGSTFGQRFADNPKYFYLYLTQHHSSQVRAIWITKSREIYELLQKNALEGYYLYSLKGIWYSLRARVYVYDNYSKDICYPLSGRAVKINLWHGIPLKKIQKDNLHDKFRNPQSLFQKLYRIPRSISDEKPSDYVLSASPYFREIFASAFRTNRVIVNGYPRNDILIHDCIRDVLPEQDQSFLERLKQQKAYYRIVLYMPTFRGSETKFLDTVDMENFSEFLRKEDLIFCVKLHPKSRLQQSFQQLNNDHIWVCDKDADPYRLCKEADLLVTDYSSIYFDYLLTGKPIIFFPYDYEEYISASRELYFDYDEFTPGRKVYQQQELEQAIAGPDQFSPDREKLKNALFEDMEEPASEQLFRSISNILNIK